MIFEVEDSEVASIELLDSALHIRFSAGRVLEGHKNGAGEGGWQPALLICKQIALDGKALEAILTAMGRLSFGQLQWLDEQSHQSIKDGQRLRTLPIPLQSEQPLLLDLGFASGQQFQLRGAGLSLQLLAKKGVESFQCG